MNLEIINRVFSLDIYGFSGVAVNNDYKATAFQLMDRLWKVVKSNNLKNKGLNVWVYEPDGMVFAGVELEIVPNHETGLEHKSVLLNRYAYYKHVGPYNLIRQAGQAMKDELKKRNIQVSSPYVEIYGHWTNDETKLETELFMCIDI